MIDVRLASVRFAADGVNVFELASGDGAALPPCDPGTRLALALPNGLTRTYFVAERTRRGGYAIGVRRDPDGRGSKYLHDRVRVGARLRIALKPPPPLDPAAARFVLAAEDVGIFGAWPYLRALDRAGRDWSLRYDAWSPSDAALLDELRAYGSRVRVHDRRAARGAPMAWDEVVGELDAGTRVLAFASAAGLAALGAELGRTASPFYARVERTCTEAARDLGPIEFDVELARSAKVVPVHERETILSAVRAAGIEAPFFCAAGICGTCRTRVLAGEPRHRDAVLTPQERAANDVMMICRSRAAGERLVLDM